MTIIKTSYNLFLFAVLLSFYIFLVMYLDNTNITTTNGLHKSISIDDFSQFLFRSRDSGGLLYGPIMGLLTRIIPDYFVDFYGHTEKYLIVCRKLSLINSFFGAGSCVVILNLTYLYTKDVLYSFFTALCHGFFAFILINSIISEDIMPAYFFFTAGFLFFFRATVEDGKNYYYYFTTLSMVACFFLHWTIIPPAIASYLIIAVFVSKRKKVLSDFSKQAIFFLTLIWIYSILEQFLFQKNHTFFSLLIPIKTSQAWVGWNIQKFESMYMGVTNYLIGGLNAHAINFDSKPMVKSLIALLFYLLLLTLLILKRNALQRFQDKMLALFGGCIFFFGELQNMYGSPQDPQFQLEPMFALTLSLNLLYPCLKKKWSRIFVILTFIGLAIENTHSLQKHRGRDSISILEYNKVRSSFPKEKVALCFTSYENLTTYILLFDYRGDSKDFYKDNYTLNLPVVIKPNISSQEFNKQVFQKIDSFIEEGKIVLASSPFTNGDYINSLAQQNVTQETIDNLKEALLKRYRVKKVHKFDTLSLAEIELRK